MVDELFSKCVVDDKGRIVIKDLIKKYFVTVSSLSEKEAKLRQCIMDGFNSLEQAKLILE